MSTSNPAVPVLGKRSQCSRRRLSTQAYFNTLHSLYISKALVLLLQGRIDVISTPDVGSSFRFYVKVEIPQPLASREAEAAKEADEPVKAFKALKLLVCDDVSRVESIGTGNEIRANPDDCHLHRMLSIERF